MGYNSNGVRLLKQVEVDYPMVKDHYYLRVNGLLFIWFPIFTGYCDSWQIYLFLHYIRLSKPLHKLV